MFSIERKNGSLLLVGQSTLGFFGGVAPTLAEICACEEGGVDIAVREEASRQCAGWISAV